MRMQAALVGALLLGGATRDAQAAAFPAGFGGNYCGGDNFITCVWFAASIDVNNVVTLKVRNTSGDPGSFFTAIGLANLGAGATASNFSFVNQGTSTSNWTLQSPPNGLTGAGITGVTWGAYRVNPPGSATTLYNGEEVWFTFTLGGTFSLANVQFALHDQGGSDQYSCSTSTKLVVSGSSSAPGTWVSNQPGAECLPPSTTVPEPATMGLLATGLIAMAGAGIVRRRRQAAST